MFVTYKVRLYPLKISSLKLIEYFNCYRYLNNMWYKTCNKYQNDLNKYKNYILNKFDYCLHCTIISAILYVPNDISERKVTHNL